ncbi:MAG: peptidoglycan DD-metalloendopeptidase family protein [Halobacteriovoraceae bacterium]|nr:peptidoglycan DD-metalloendopeptidase family protein [Halobacteriovoraceae bacterium]
MKGIVALIFSFLLLAPSFGAKKSSLSPRKTLKEERIKLKRITNKISSIEKQLESSNQKVLKLGKVKQRLEGNLFTLKKELLESMASLTTGKQQLKGLLNSIAVNTVEEEGPGSILATKILKDELKKRLAGYNRDIKATKLQQDRLSKVEQDFKFYETKEQMLLEAIANLEELKRQEAQSYIQVRNTVQETRKKLQSIKLKKKKNKKSISLRSQLGVFDLPLENYTSIDYKKKGVTFLFNERQPVRASRKGKVIHSGALSTFGNVVMIDHGKDVISLCLGDFKPQLKKGQFVKEGQILGYVHQPRSQKPGKVYFEVRKKNKAQETIHLLDEGALASANTRSGKS